MTDYRAMGFTLGWHLLALLRDRINLDRLTSAEQLATLRNGQFARACGLVTVRQHPGTAHGVLFMTLENETSKLMTEVGLWIPRRQRPPEVCQSRARRACLGELIQIDGSEHRWFEEWAPTYMLLVYIDDQRCPLDTSTRPIQCPMHTTAF